MKIKNIVEGEVFKSINKLYEKLELPKCNGKQRILQDKEIARYLHYELTQRTAYEIVIVEIYNKALERVDDRIGNGNNKYQSLLAPLIENYCYTQGEFRTTFTSLLVELGIVHPMYKDMYSNRDKCLELIQAEEEDSYESLIILDNIFNKSTGSTKGAINTALRRLERQNKIKLDIEHYVQLVDNTVRLATTEEEEYIQYCTNNTLIEMLEEDIIKKASLGWMFTFRQRIEFSNRMSSSLVEYGEIAKHWKTLHVTNINCDTHIVEKETLNQLRHEFAQTVFNRIINIHWKGRLLQTGWGNKNNRYEEIKPYAPTEKQDRVRQIIGKVFRLEIDSYPLLLIQ